MRSVVPRLRRDEERRKMIFKSVNKWEETELRKPLTSLLIIRRQEKKNAQYGTCL